MDLPLPDGPAAEPVPAAVLAQRAIRALELQPPAARISADTQGYVGVPLWLWVEGGPEASGPVSATAAAGASAVTATGRLSGVEWEMGPPGALVRCAGTGTPWTGQSGPSPDCGFTYTQRSTPERTGGVGWWPVTVTAVWQVTWEGVTGGVPVAGEQTLLLASAAELVVGEVQVLVDGSGGGGTR
ncbi:hypothetical protein BJF78_26240 [Pseudonocardia sp. CNS-139]|nr:hypothetical protein BJF78_26240 [Pseudonocardia sp. CNS-139]